MASFCWTDKDWRNFSEAELDRFALDYRGELGSLSGGFTCRGSIVPRPETGYHAQWIETSGVGNQGTLVLVGLTPEKQALLAQGLKRPVGNEFEAPCVDYSSGRVILLCPEEERRQAAQ